MSRGATPREYVSSGQSQRQSSATYSTVEMHRDIEAGQHGHAGRKGEEST